MLLFSSLDGVSVIFCTFCCFLRVIFFILFTDHVIYLFSYFVVLISLIFFQMYLLYIHFFVFNFHCICIHFFFIVQKYYLTISFFTLILSFIMTYSLCSEYLLIILTVFTVHRFRGSTVGRSSFWISRRQTIMMFFFYINFNKVSFDFFALLNLYKYKQIIFVSWQFTDNFSMNWFHNKLDISMYKIKYIYNHAH